MINFIKSILEDRRKLGIAAIVIIAGTIILTVFVAQKQQEIRQRAAGEQTKFFFSTGDGCTNPVTSASFGINTIATLSLCLNTNNMGTTNLVEGFDVTIEKGNGITFTGISDGVDGAKLKTAAFNSVMADETIRFSKVDQDGITVSGNTLYLGKITLTTGSSGNGDINMTKAQVIDQTGLSALTVARPILPYTISVASIPTPTLVPGAKAPPCFVPASILTQLGLATNTVRGYGDVDLDGDVDSNDSLFILRFVAQLNNPTALQIEVGDVDTAWGVLSSSSSITSVDSLMVQRYLADLPISSGYPGTGTISLPVCAGEPTITPTPTVTPTPTTCNDGTPVNTCKTTKPQYCPATGGPIINNCSDCGCPNGQTCNASTGACAAPTPTPTTAPISTITPTPGQSCPLKGRGDANCDDIINIFDFNIWRDEFLGVANTTSSNFDGSGGEHPITIFDFNIWRDGFLDSSLPH